MPSLLARTYGRIDGNSGGGRATKSGASSTMGAMSGKSAHGGATLPGCAWGRRGSVNHTKRVVARGGVNGQTFHRQPTTTIRPGKSNVCQPWVNAATRARCQRRGVRERGTGRRSGLPTGSTGRAPSIKFQRGSAACGAKRSISKGDTTARTNRKLPRKVYNRRGPGKMPCVQPQRAWQPYCQKRPQVALQAKISSARAGDVALMVGTAQESDARHAGRHPLCEISKWSKVCERCCFIQWKRTNPPPPWMSPKPAFMAGAWGLGCIWCAASKLSPIVQARRREHMAQNAAAGQCQQAVSRASKWSSYEVRLRDRLTTGRTQGNAGRTFNTAIHQHQSTDLHRLSNSCFHSAAAHLGGLPDPRGQSAQRTANSRDVQNYSESVSTTPCEQEAATSRQPPTQPVVIESCADGSQRRQFHSKSTESKAESTGYSKLGSTTDPFRGRVPQAHDWIDVWAESTSAVSNRGLLHIR